MFKAGPLVSFNGSPTVSPITAASCSFDFLPFTFPSLSLNYPDSIYFLALSQAPPALADDIAIDTPEIKIPGKTPATQVGPNKTPAANGVPKTIKAGKNISVNEAYVATLIQAS